MGKEKSHQILIGFALESQDALANGKQKLKNKNLDAVVINALTDKGAGFGHDTNKISFLQRGKDIIHYPLKSKKEVAQDVLNHLKTMFDAS